MVTVLSINTIVSDEHAHGGQPVIAGTGIRVTDLVSSHLYRGLTPDELAVNFGLSLGQVYAALAYYYQHRAEVDALIEAEAERAQAYLNKLDEHGRIIRFE
jgi:uncharacterized protein (DUF433 family)